MDSAIDPRGWLMGARHLPSPNFNARPHGEVSLLVIHNISLPPGQFGGDAAAQLFLNQLDCGAHPAFAELAGLRVSAHLLIDRGGAVTQFVAFGERAWHAGRSRFAGRPDCNDFALGIELEGTDTSGYTEAQMRVLAATTATLMRRYPALAPQRIVGHCDIAPGRKTDPGPGFDWCRLRTLLELESTP
ncbi:MAG: 1,6-anhydro-N-acetylmuramyl-L-alanine amidase AmpD [Porticoccaceae bacterium]|nr:MAG: 1,6-anhydro-N-acetylmuramyl-L-alanine amidase AmpD [Porticoccaceae bacterium]